MIKILIVDDEPDVESLFLQRFKKKIKAKEWSILFCQNGKEALQVLKANPDIDLVLSDINMPEMDGLTLLEKIKNSGSSAKSIIISAYGDMKNIRTAMNRGAFDFIMKPMDFDDVSLTVDKALEHIQTLKTAVENQERLELINRELSGAKIIQESILPISFESRPSYEILAGVKPARDVGGDFYDYFFIDKEHLALVIADVSGKGISSALFAMKVQVLLKTAAMAGLGGRQYQGKTKLSKVKGSANSSCWLQPKEHIEYVNALCIKNNDNCMFVTLFYGILNLKTGVLAYVNAGHNYPYRLNNKTLKAVASVKNVPLAASESAEFNENILQLAKGDYLFLYTDGITEARNNEGESFGKARLEKLLAGFCGNSARQLKESIWSSIDGFSKTARQFDDMTYMILKYNA